MFEQLNTPIYQRQVDPRFVERHLELLELLEEQLASYNFVSFVDEGENLKERLHVAIQQQDYLTIKQCLIEIRNILSDLLGSVRLSLILLYLTKLVAFSFLSKYKANLEIPPTARQGEKIESFPPHVCIYA